jgi:hypothetical protein
MNTNKQKLATFDQFIELARQLYAQKYLQKYPEYTILTTDVKLWRECKDIAAKEIYGITSK